MQQQTTIQIPNIFLIIILCIYPFIVMFFCFLFMIAFQSKLDRFQNIFPKIIVLVAMTLAISTILFLPFEVWNTTSKGQLAEAVSIIWQVVFGLIILFVIVILPYALFYYESAAPDRSIAAQCGIACGSTLGICLAWAILIGVLYAFLGVAVLKINTYSSIKYFTSLDGAASGSVACEQCIAFPRELEIRMSILVFMIAALSVIGWFFLTICGGCGLTALPLDCCLALCKKEKRISFEQWTKEQHKFARRTERLIEMGEALDKLRREKRGLLKTKNIRLYRDFKNSVYTVQDDFNLVKRAYKKGGKSPWSYACNCIAGFVFFILSACWFIHMVLWMTVPETPIWPGLNFFFYVVDLAFPVFGAIGYAIFTFYLLICVLYGMTVVMARISLVNVYPIRFKDTLLNAFILHTWELSVISLTLVQFVCYAFSGYSNNTSLGVMFFVFVRNTKGFFWFFQYVHYAFFVTMFFGFWLSILFAIPWISKSKEQKRLDKVLASNA